MVACWMREPHRLERLASDHLFGGRVTIWRLKKAGDARAWIDTPQPTPSKECERGRAEVLGTFSARAPGRSAESLVRRLRGFTPSGLGGT